MVTPDDTAVLCTAAGPFALRRAAAGSARCKLFFSFLSFFLSVITLSEVASPLRPWQHGKDHRAPGTRHLG
jgi:hypothetical protein